MASYQSLSDLVVALTLRDPGIDRVVMFDHFMYYFLDPYALPPGVSVEYPASGYMVFYQLTEGDVFTQHPGGRMYSYLRFAEPTFATGEHRALYVDLMPMPTYPYRWQSGSAQMYLFSYTERFQPPVDLDNIKPIDPAEMTRTYRKLFGSQAD